MTDRKFKILVINPGSTSTKVSLFLDEEELFERNLFHDAPELLKFPHVNDQLPFRAVSRRSIRNYTTIQSPQWAGQSIRPSSAS